MDEELPKRLLERGRRLGRVGKNKLILLSLILMLVMGLFFYSFSQTSAANDFTSKPKTISPEVLDPLNKIGKGIGQEKKPEQKISLIKKPADEVSVVADAGEENSLESSVLALVSGHPMENMAMAIAEQDQNVASFLVAIARKESSWGEHVPTKNGQDCFNYWGYKGGQNPTEGGYSCFDSPEQAVDIVGARIKNLIDQGIDTAEKMLVWKCGSSCATHNPQDVRKWVADVDLYYEKMNKL